MGTTSKMPEPYADDTPGLVAIMNNRADFVRARDEHWYRIPERSAPACLATSRWIAFYLTAAFGLDKWSVRAWAAVHKIERVQRVLLLPEEADHSRASDWYYRVSLGWLQERPEPIFSRRRRRLVFIPSVWGKFRTALELNDLHHGSPLEDRLWAAFKQEGIDAERQWFEGTGDTLYCLDFALFCRERSIDVECDGDRWHSNPRQALADNLRNNFLEQRGWHVLRFNTTQVNDQLLDCVQDVKNTINRCGGLLPPELTSADKRDEKTSHNEARFSTAQADNAAGLSLALQAMLNLRQQGERRPALAELRTRYGIAAIARALAQSLAALPVTARERAVWCLGELGTDPNVIHGLINCLGADARPSVRRLAYSACRKVGVSTLEAVILQRLDEEKEQVLQYALEALARCGSARAVPSLQRILAQPHPDYVIRAARHALIQCARRPTR